MYNDSSDSSDSSDSHVEERSKAKKHKNVKKPVIKHAKSKFEENSFEGKAEKQSRIIKVDRPPRVSKMMYRSHRDRWVLEPCLEMAKPYQKFMIMEEREILHLNTGSGRITLKEWLGIVGMCLPPALHIADSSKRIELLLPPFQCAVIPTALLPVYPSTVDVTTNQTKIDARRANKRSASTSYETISGGQCEVYINACGPIWATAFAPDEGLGPTDPAEQNSGSSSSVPKIVTECVRVDKYLAVGLSRIGWPLAPTQSAKEEGWSARDEFSSLHSTASSLYDNAVPPQMVENLPTVDGTYGVGADFQRTTGVLDTTHNLLQVWRVSAEVRRGEETKTFVKSAVKIGRPKKSSSGDFLQKQEEEEQEQEDREAAEEAALEAAEAAADAAAEEQDDDSEEEEAMGEAVEEDDEEDAADALLDGLDKFERRERKKALTIARKAKALAEQRAKRLAAKLKKAAVKDALKAKAAAAKLAKKLQAAQAAEEKKQTPRKGSTPAKGTPKKAAVADDEEEDTGFNITSSLDHLPLPQPASVDLAYCVALNSRGPTWGLTWSPMLFRRGSNPQLLGVLAVVCGDGSCLILVLPRSDPALAAWGSQSRGVDDVQVFTESDVCRFEVRLPDVAVTTAAWSPHRAFELVCGMMDGSVTVWKLEADMFSPGEWC